MKRSLKLLLGVGVVGAGVFALSRAFAKPGDKLQVGDDAFVRVGPGGIDPTAVPGLQAAGPVSQVVVHVTALDAASLDGPITAYVQTGAASMTPLQNPIGPVQVPRSAVASITRNGLTVVAS